MSLEVIYCFRNSVDTMIYIYISCKPGLGETNKTLIKYTNTPSIYISINLFIYIYTNFYYHVGVHQLGRVIVKNTNIGSRFEFPSPKASDGKH